MLLEIDKYINSEKGQNKLIEIFNKYGMKGTFNLNSARVYAENEDVSAKDLKSLYEGHEVAVHTLDHPNLTQLSKEEIIRQALKRMVR